MKDAQYEWHQRWEAKEVRHRVWQLWDTWRKCWFTGTRYPYTDKPVQWSSSRNAKHWAWLISP